MPPSQKIKIRIASSKDRETLISIYFDLLKFLDAFDHDMLPVKSNAEWMIDNVFLPAAEAGDPVLIAWEGKKPVGSIFWTIQKIPYQCRWKMAQGYGTYISEDYRNQKLGTLLRNKGAKILKSKGIEKIMFMTLFENKISIKASDKFGGIPYARVDLVDLK